MFSGFFILNFPPDEEWLIVGDFNFLDLLKIGINSVEMLMTCSFSMILSKLRI
jgi:hypothetical protein